MLAVAGLIGFRAVAAGRPALVVAAGLTALVGLAILGALAPLRYRQLRDSRADVSCPALVRAVTAGVVVTALAAAVAVLIPG